MTKKSNTAHIRIRAEDKIKFRKLKNDIAKAQRMEISDTEVMRRTLNIPNLPSVLKRDAELKRKFMKL